MTNDIATAPAQKVRNVAASRTSPKRLARIAGVLYLLNGIFAGFAFGFVIANVYVAGAATTTTGNVVASAGLVRLGVIADLVQATIWVFLALVLYTLLKDVHQGAARTMVALVAVGAAIVCLNDVFQFESVRVATDSSYDAALGSAGSKALVLLLLEMHHYGFLIAQIFFGLWLVPLGYLASKSGMFPKALGVLLVFGGACYLVGMLAAFLIPDVGETINVWVTIPSAIAEISMVPYLLVVGVKTVKPRDDDDPRDAQAPAGLALPLLHGVGD
jgi:hypothetical protein